MRKIDEKLSLVVDDVRDIEGASHPLRRPRLAFIAVWTASTFKLDRIERRLSSAKQRTEMNKSEKLIAKRAKEIFEREKRSDEVWGSSFQERESSTASTLLDIVDDVRHQYLNRARKELQDEGAI